MVIKRRNGQKGQIWYFDQKSLTIKTRINNKSWDIASAGKTNNMQIWSTNSGWFQLFKYEDGHFINWTNKKALDAQQDTEANAVVVAAQDSDKDSQEWKVVYLDKSKEEKSDGFNEEYGFFGNRNFYIRSRMPMRRVMRCHGAGWIHLNRWVKNRKDQLFFFDEKTNTVRNGQWKTHAIERYSNGGHPYLRATSSISSRWW